MDITIMLLIILAIFVPLRILLKGRNDGFTSMAEDMGLSVSKGKNKKGEVKKPMSMKIPLAVISVMVVLIIILMSVTVVGAGERGVLVKFGNVQDKVYGEGLYFIMPIQDSMIKMTVRTQKHEVNASASTKDLLDVATTVAVNFHLDPTKVNTLYQNIGPDYEETVIAPAVQEVVKATTAKFNAEELITQREAVKETIDSALKDRLASRDIIVETTSITNFQFPDAFNMAITDKQTAVQKALEAQNKLAQVQFEAQQAVAKANGDAQAIQIINEQLQKSPQYISYLSVTKWNGVLPSVTGGAVPFVQIPTQTSTPTTTSP